MCGIIGIIGENEVAPLLIAGLKRLEYRGYDSAGIATVVEGGIDRRRAEGKIVNLESLLSREPVEGHIGIGHTRWATHGAPTQANAHPHADDHVVLVHNGIIENFQKLKGELEALGHRFETETDTEAVVHLVSYGLAQGQTPQQAVAAALKRLEGAFAPCHPVRGPQGFDDRRPPRQPAGDRLWRGRDVFGLGCAGAGAPDHPNLLFGGGRLGRGHDPGRGGARFDRRHRQARDQAHQGFGRDGWQG